MLTKDFHSVTLPLVVSLSGGMDSSVLLAECVNELGKANVSAISFDYGQRHVRELTAAMAVAHRFAVPHKVVNIRTLRDLTPGSSQTDRSVPVPHGHYEDSSMRATVVPNRNSVMLNLVASWAISQEIRTIAYAAHAGDHAVYPDCRPEFVEKLAALFAVVDYNPIHLFTPYISISKREIALRGCTEGVPFILTYSCYEGRDKHCGKCGTCVERKEALLGFDNTEYEG